MNFLSEVEVLQALEGVAQDSSYLVLSRNRKEQIAVQYLKNIDTYNIEVIAETWLKNDCTIVHRTFDHGSRVPGLSIIYQE